MIGACIYDDEMVDRVKYAYGKGFQIGSHTWAHEHLPTLNADQGKATIVVTFFSFILF